MWSLSFVPRSLFNQGLPQLHSPRLLLKDCEFKKEHNAFLKCIIYTHDFVFKTLGVIFWLTLEILIIYLIVMCELSWKPNAELTWGPIPIRLAVLLQHGHMDRKRTYVHIYKKGQKNSVTEILSLSLLRSAKTFLMRFNWDRCSTSHTKTNNGLTLQHDGNVGMSGVFDQCAGTLRPATGQSDL